MNILIINCGSSSIKYKLYSFPKKNLIAKGLIEKIGDSKSTIKDHHQGVSALFDTLLKEKAIGNLDEIAAIGHRVVHGAEEFQEPSIINDKIIKKIAECSSLAPLHNPANLEGILGCKEIMPSVVQVAVFDTAFHQSIPEHAYLYAIPLSYYKKYGIRKYGFHGTSHQFVSHQASRILRKPPQNLRLITCHLGNGCSVAAIDRGKSIDTSMGFTPLEGLMMGTRCGDIDVAAVFNVMEKESLTLEAIDAILNKKSGLLGVSGVSNDIRAIKKEAAAGNARAQLALDMFLYRIKKYIGAYYFILGGADAVCITAGIGENNPDIVERIKESVRAVAGVKTKVLVIPTDEELMIAELAYQVLQEELL
ncbi:MAG: acetate kinase [Candidatus Omnitrophota bacterium]|nr:acetate kinase [Candidatus Omnitrophota bacterium]